MEPETPTKTYTGRVIQREDEQRTPPSARNQCASAFSSPALRSLSESALRERLREAYFLLKEKEKNLFLAASVGQELLDTNQQLQSNYTRVRDELAEAQDSLKRLDIFPTEDEEPESRLHGRRRSMATANRRKHSDNEESVDDQSDNSLREQQWIKTHLQPLQSQLQITQERMDDLMVERDQAETEKHLLQQEHASMQRRAAEAALATEKARQQMERAEEDKARMQEELQTQRDKWLQRWTDHKAQCKMNDGIADANSTQIAGDVAAQLRAERHTDEMQMRHSAVQAELELLRSQMQRMEEERVNEWEPMRSRWLACEEALQELQETHQSTCEALAQAEARLADLENDPAIDPVSHLASQKTATSILGEVDTQRRRAESQQRALENDHAALKRSYTRVLGSQTRMKQQVARLTQLAAVGTSEARMKRLEAALGEAECQRQALLWAAMDQRHTALTDGSGLLVVDKSGGSTDETTLVLTLRARLKQALADCSQAQRELRTAHILRANEVQRNGELEREAAEVEAKLRRAMGEITSLRSNCDALRRNTRERLPVRLSETQQSSPLPPRKRTRADSTLPKVSSNDSPMLKKSGPMSLAFVINEESSSVDEPTQYKQSSNPPKKEFHVEKKEYFGNDNRNISEGDHGVDGDIRDAPTLDSSEHNVYMKAEEHGSDTLAVAQVRELSDLNNAANRGLKSWLGTLGAAHASATIARERSLDMVETKPAQNTETSIKDPDSGNDNSNSNSNGKDNNDTSLGCSAVDGVDEIYVGSRMPKKPIECTNQ
ncbi:hypothetical protein H4217_004400 [Coemansia sp. RSA 1939]|nr:hypothetical protein H4217_004400 [Coemansia sp. RSA 1939]KAJ2613450.1 hypothetical protein EV177_002524 [Coemansia sp. RSA 1804]